MSSSTAASAASASAPRVSIVTRLPLPAASIITPMMLFALTRRPLRDSQTSQANPVATCVSLAEARACRPSLFTMSASASGTAHLSLEPRHAFTSAAQRLLDDGGERFVAIGEGADEHRQARPGDAFDPARLQQ